MDRAEEILEMLEDTFGEDSRQYRKAFHRYNQLISNGTPLDYRMAAMYLNWCIKHPARIGGESPPRNCRCISGWLDEGEDGFVPCPKCLPGGHSRWANDFKVASEDEDEMF